MKNATQFKSAFNQLILPLRLGVFSLYSARKVSIFNTTIVKILDIYRQSDDIFKRDNMEEALNNPLDVQKIEFHKHVLDVLIKDVRLGYLKPN